MTNGNGRQPIDQLPVRESFRKDEKNMKKQIDFHVHFCRRNQSHHTNKRCISCEHCKCVCFYVMFLHLNIYYVHLTAIQTYWMCLECDVYSMLRLSRSATCCCLKFLVACLIAYKIVLAHGVLVRSHDLR